MKATGCYGWIFATPQISRAAQSYGRSCAARKERQAATQIIVYTILAGVSFGFGAILNNSYLNSIKTQEVKESE